MARATSGERKAALIEQPAVWHKTHAVLASALAISSMTSVNVIGSSSPPSKLRGSSSRKKLGVAQRVKDGFGDAAGTLDFVGGSGDAGAQLSGAGEVIHGLGLYAVPRWLSTRRVNRETCGSTCH